MSLGAGRIWRRALAALALTLLLVATVLPLVLGGSAQRTYQNLLATTLDALPTGWVVFQHYDRGWFSSRANAELALQPPGGSAASTAGIQRIRLDSRIEQGSAAWFSRAGFPVLARVRTRVEWVNAPVRLPPLLITTDCSPDGSALARLLVPAIEQSGVDDDYRLRSAEMTGQVHYEPGPKSLAVEIDIPAVELITPAGPLLHLTDARLKSDLRAWTGGFYAGTSHLQIGSTSLGDAGAGATSTAPALAGLAIDLTQTPSDRTLDVRLDARADLARLGGHDYRTAQIGVAAQSLDGESLAELIEALQTLSSGTRSQAMRGLIGATLVTQLLPRFLAAGPQVALDPVRLETPEGPVSLRLRIAAPKPGSGAPPPGLNAVGWLTAVTGEGEVDLPETVALDWLARVNQGTSTTARQRLDRWLADGWVSVREGRVMSSLRLADGLLRVNGKRLPLLGSVAPGIW